MHKISVSVSHDVARWWDIYLSFICPPVREVTRFIRDARLNMSVELWRDRSHHIIAGPGVSVRRYIYLLYLSVDISICYTSQICRYFSEMSRLLKYRSCKTRCQMSTFKQLVLLKHTFSSNMKYNSLFADDTNTYSRVGPAWTRLHASPT